MSEEDDDAIVWVCRDIPGDHVGGPDCFCCPFVISAFDECAAQKLREMIEAPERQVS